MIDLAGRKVLVTGGSRGIGAACCRLFAEAGASVLVHYHRAKRQAEELVARLPVPSGPPHAAFVADVARTEDVKRLLDFAGEHFGGLDCLVNNAGVWVENPLVDFDLDRYEETLAINLRGPFLCAAAALPLLELSGDGNVVNLSSTAGQRGEASYSPYAASKGALIAVTKSWAVELAPRVRVNAVAPGWVDTDMTTDALAADRRRILAEIPLHRVATAEDVAGSVLFLASPLARQITGEIVNVNGGSVLAG